MLRTRLLTAIILVPITVGFIYLGGLPFLGLVICLTTLAEIEFCQLMSRRGFRGTHVFGIALVWLFLLDGAFPDWSLMRPGLAAVLSLSLGWLVFRFGRSNATDWAGPIASGLYVGLFASSFVRLRGLSVHGLWSTLLAAASMVMADSAAYFVGTRWGKHRLAPVVSPAKTWEGYASGIAAGGFTGCLFAWLGRLVVGPGATMPPSAGFLLGLLIGTVAPLGDLVVSAVKREAGVKDSGQLLPGHGGMLDRLDSVLWAGVLAYHYVVWFVS